MKSLIIFTATFLVMTLGSFFAQAETWQGQGVAYSLSGEKQGEYQLKIENYQEDEQTFSTVTVSIEGREPVISKCSRKEHSGEGWSTICESGLTGGGSCYGEGMCQSYLQGPGDEAFATTIVFDNENEMRLLRTQLKNNRAVRMFREKLTKTN